MYLAAEEGAPEGIGLFIPPWNEVILAGICLVLIALAVAKYGVPRYLKVLDERAEKIEGGLKRAEEAEAEIAQMRSGLDAEKEQARIEAAKIREEAKADAAAMVAAAKTKAAEEARRIQESAQRQIESERKAAEISLRQDVGSLATALAEQIVGEALKDKALAGRVIDRFLADLANQSETAGRGA
ncbi:MAG: F0F1 ATP synthase subunit B [Bifidobacteriaceae bacterium]|jgi:F-type H+-transporting ATPase subunit b|nr:F0F1 ATP synthase subunit B [Bifidobacteriaceae bacterium]